MEKIAVYGAGTIGSCEATLIIGHGLPCVVIGHSESGLERCRKAIAQNWDDLIAEGLATEQNKTAAMKLLTVTNDPAALAGCTFVFEAVGYEPESTIAQNVYPDLCDTKETQTLVKEGLANSKTGQAAGQGLYDWSQKDGDDFRRRKQSPYFDGVKIWTMPG